MTQTALRNAGQLAGCNVPFLRKKRLHKSLSVCLGALIIISFIVLTKSHTKIYYLYMYKLLFEKHYITKSGLNISTVVIITVLMFHTNPLQT